MSVSSGHRAAPLLNPGPATTWPPVAIYNHCNHFLLECDTYGLKVGYLMLGNYSLIPNVVLMVSDTLPGIIIPLTPWTWCMLRSLSDLRPPCNPPGPTLKKRQWSVECCCTGCLCAIFGDKIFHSVPEPCGVERIRSWDDPVKLWPLPLRAWQRWLCQRRWTQVRTQKARL